MTLRPVSGRLSFGRDPSHGIYVPTVTGVTNVASLNALGCFWQRIGNLVTIQGQTQVNPTATGATQFDVSLPFPTGFAAISEAVGVMASAAGEAGSVIANPTDDRLSIYFVTIDTADHLVSWTATYLVSP